MISADGQIVPPPPDAKPLALGGKQVVSIENPPGLYGSEDGVVAHNLLAADASFTRIAGAFDDTAGDAARATRSTSPAT